MGKKPFDPNRPFKQVSEENGTVVAEATPKFDPSKPFVKKKEPTINEAEPSASSTEASSNGSSMHAEQPSGPSEKVGGNAQEKFNDRVEQLNKFYQNQFERSMEPTIKEHQSIFQKEFDKKKSELQLRADNKELSLDDANKQLKQFSEDKQKELNLKLQDEAKKKGTEFEQQSKPDIEKFLNIYGKDFQKEDFEENKERNPALSFAKTAWTTFSKDIPSAAYAALALGRSTARKIENKVIESLPKPSEEFSEGFGKTIMKGFEKVFGSEASKYHTNLTPDQASKKLIIEDLTKASDLANASQEQKKYIINSLDKVKDGDFLDMVNYAASAAGQGVGYIPASIGTRGATSLVQEMGSIYLDAVNRIAQEETKKRGKEVTIEDVINEGKDNVVYPLVFGLGAGILDAFGANRVAGSFTKDQVMNSLRKRAIDLTKTVGIETATEGTQGALENAGVDLSGGKTVGEALKNTDIKNIKESAIQGGIGALFLGGGAHIGSAARNAMTGNKIQVVNPKAFQVQSINGLISDKLNELSNLSSANNITDLEKAANEIVKKVSEKPTPEEGVQNDSINKLGISSEIGKGTQPIKTQPNESTSTQEAGGGGVVQGAPTGSEESSQEETVKEPFGIAFAPYREKNVTTPEEDQKIRELPDYKLHQENVQKIAEGLGIDVVGKSDTWGGYVDSETGRPVQEVSNVIHINATPEKARMMAALLGQSSPEMQDSVLLGNYSKEGKGTEFSYKFESPEKAQEALKLMQKNGLQYYTLDPKTSELTILDTDNSILGKIDTFNQSLADNGIQSELKHQRVNAEFIGQGDYAGIIGEKMGHQRGEQKGFDPHAFVEEAKGKYATLKSTPLERVFIYGTLEDRNTRKKALGENVKAVPASAKGNVTDKNSYPDFHPQGKEDVKGELLTLTPEQVKKLDNWETKYNRKEITLDNGERAWVYEEKKDQSEPVQGTPAKPEPGTPGGSPPTTGNKGGEGPVQEPNKRQFAVAKRILASDANEAIKQGIREKGDSYIPKGLNITEKEASDIIDHHGVDKTELMLKDPSNGLTPDTRVVLSGKLYEKYSKEGQNEKAIDLAIWAENYLMQAGRAANAGKFWKMITSSGEDQIVLAIERQQEHVRQSALGEIDRATARIQLEAEFRRLVEEKVQSTVESRLEAAKLISKEKRKEIGDFFDKLKVDTKNNIATASILPIGVLPHVWNAAVDVIKQAVLTGADVANAIQAGIDHIKANQKEPFDEQKFREEFTPEVQKIMPRRKVKASDIDAAKIKTPRISGKRKTDFINKVVEAYNNGELTDKKFDEIYASKLGFREFTSEDRAKIRKLAKTISESEKFDQQLRELPADQFTRENISKMKGLREAAKNANKELQEYSQAPADVFDTLIAIMQANLMSTMSLVSNVWYNLTYSPLRASSLGVATMLDYGLSKMARIGMMPKALESRSIDFTAIQKGYFQGAWNGTLEGLDQIRTGTQTDERNLREIQSKFNPAKAIERWGNKDRTIAQKANDYIEGTIGWEAETIFRLLNLGDKPFKRAAEFGRALELGTQKGLKGKELQKFLLLPDAESEAEIVKAGREATFQQDTSGGRIVQNALTQFLNFIRDIPLIGGVAKVIIKSQIPFVKTPLNLITETIQYATPPATLATGIYQIAKGNKRSGSILVGKSIVGAMLWQASIHLFLKGLLTGDDDKDKKKRDFQSEGHTVPPNSINTSAISRGLAFGDWSIHDGDTWVSYSKMGVAGICMDNYSNIYKERIAKNGDISGGPESYMADMLESAPRVASSTIEQSFLQGTSSALEALKSGDERTMNNWLIKTTESVGSILYPNTIATVAKASDEFSRDTNDENLWQHLKNVYKAKLFIGDELPPKVNLWGDRIKGNPEGRSKYAYYLFDPSKFKEISTDDFRFRLYQAFKTDYSGDWLPSMPLRNINANGQKVKLTTKEYEELCIDVGKERAALVSSYVNSQIGNKKPNEDAKAELKMRYDLGYELGKERFMISHGMNVKFHFRQPLELKSMIRKLNKQKVKF